MRDRFDVFFSYHTADHAAVTQVVQRLHERGVRVFLDRDRNDAGSRLAALFEDTGLRPRLAASYGGPSYGRAAEYLLEQLDSEKLGKWRQLGRLLAVVPSQCRADVEAVVFWDQRPASLRDLCRGLAVAHQVLYGRRPDRDMNTSGV